eukprot:TRINITY_DN4161_c0_g1_i2.p1 TRINITY_DN4161_c0_g1~~TRINITY_DN4161_c0_g1_i2.p1  ORF type:complete len:282 (+),score=66.63 TRINITY_DN4161_c0_g1_i2:786-1631(+)
MLLRQLSLPLRTPQPHATPRKRVLVYTDEGISDDSLLHLVSSLYAHLDTSLHTIELISGADMAAEATWRDAVCVIVPGGRSSPFEACMTLAGVGRVKHFVEQQGGAYLGLGAGAYFATRITNFGEGTPLALHKTRNLALLDGVAQGPVNGRFKYGDKSGAEAAAVQLDSRAVVSLYLNGGCEFLTAGVPQNARLITLGSYAAEQPSAAILQCSFASGGVAILSGVHPEVEGCTMACETSTCPPGVAQALIRDDAARTALWRRLLVLSHLHLRTPLSGAASL